MNDILNTIVLISLCVLSLAAIGWFAMPKPERGRVREVSAADWAVIVKTGARVLSTWGPRLDFTRPNTAVAPARSTEPCAPGSAH